MRRKEKGTEGEDGYPIVQSREMWKEPGSKRNYPKSSSDSCRSTVQILVCQSLFMQSNTDVTTDLLMLGLQSSDSLILQSKIITISAQLLVSQSAYNCRLFLDPFNFYLPSLLETAEYKIQSTQKCSFSLLKIHR